MSKCNCDPAIPALLYAAAVLISKKCGSSNVALGGGGGILNRLDCPTNCSPASCDEIGDKYEELIAACGGNTACEAQVQALYELALQYCEPA